MKHKRVWITAILPLLAAIAFYGRLPDIIPIHWGLHGEVNGTAPRPVILLLGASGLILTAILLVAARLDPQKDNIAKRANILYNMIVVLNLLMLAVIGMTVTEAIRPNTLDVTQLVTASIGILFVVIGNYLPKVKQNYLIGVRTSWALSDEEVWKQSQRVGGWLMFACGLLILLCGFLLPPAACLIAVIVLTLLAAGASTLASYLLYRKRHP